MTTSDSLFLCPPSAAPCRPTHLEHLPDDLGVQDLLKGHVGGVSLQPLQRFQRRVNLVVAEVLADEAAEAHDEHALLQCLRCLFQVLLDQAEVGDLRLRRKQPRPVRLQLHLASLFALLYQHLRRYLYFFTRQPGSGC